MEWDWERKNESLGKEERRDKKESDGGEGERATLLASHGMATGRLAAWQPGNVIRWHAEVLTLNHESRILGQLAKERATQVLHGPNSTESNLFHHGETT